LAGAALSSIDQLPSPFFFGKKTERYYAMKRWLLIGGGLGVSLIVLIIVVSVYVYSSLDSLIKAAVEKVGSKITQVEVQLDEVEVSITSGQGTLRGLTVGNPKGFETENAFRLGEISLKIDVGTVTKDTVVIKEILISAPQVTYELGTGGSNIDVIRRNVAAFMAAQRTGSEGESKPKNGDDEGRKLIIEDLYVRDGKVRVSASMLKGKTLSASIPNIHLTDIGKKKGGATPGEVVDKVIGAIGQGTQKAVATLNLGKVADVAKEGAAKAKAEVEKVGKDVGGTLKKLLGN
jgi:hypothetical protein